MVLGEDGKYQRRRSCREVVECVEGEGPDEEGEEEWRDDGRKCKSCEEE